MSMHGEGNTPLQMTDNKKCASMLKDWIAKNKVKPESKGTNISVTNITDVGLHSVVKSKLEEEVTKLKAEVAAAAKKKAEGDKAFNEMIVKLEAELVEADKKMASKEKEIARLRAELKAAAKLKIKEETSNDK